MNRNLSKKKKNEIVSKLIIFASLFIPVLILYQGLFYSFPLVSLLVAAGIVGSYVLLSKIHKTIPSHISSGFMTSSVVVLLFYSTAYLIPITSEALRLIFKPLALSFFAYGLARTFEIPMVFRLDRAYNHGLVLLIGFIYGVLFFLLNEPIASTLLTNFFVLLVYTIVIAFGEELLFRGILMTLFIYIVDVRKAVHYQAIAFSIVHMLSFTTLINYYKLYPTFFGVNVVISLLLYAVALYLFSLTASRFLIRNRYNLVLPMQFHWLVNLFNITLVILL